MTPLLLDPTAFLQYFVLYLFQKPNVGHVDNVLCMPELIEHDQSHNAWDISLGEDTDIGLPILPTNLEYFLETVLVAFLGTMSPNQ